MIQFIHNLKKDFEVLCTGKRRRTIAVELPDAEIILAAAAKQIVGEDGASFPLKIGVAIVNPCDLYVKKLGRELAQSRLAETQAEVEEIVFSAEERINVIVRLPENGHRLFLGLKKDKSLARALAFYYL